MVRARPSRRDVLAAIALGVPLSQLGHAAAYLVRYGPAGLALEGRGAHVYFPALLRTSAAALAAGVLGALVVVALARLAAGATLGLRRGRAAPLLPLLLVLAAVQLDVYVLQETLETLLTRGGLDAGFLWGLAWSGVPVQLALALLGACTLRWLSIRFEAAMATLRVAWRCRRPALPAATLVISCPGPVLAFRCAAAGGSRSLSPPEARRSPADPFVIRQCVSRRIDVSVESNPTLEQELDVGAGAGLRSLGTGTVVAVLGLLTVLPLYARIYALQAQGRSPAAIGTASMHMSQMNVFWSFPILQATGIAALVWAYAGVALGLVESGRRAAWIPLTRAQVDRVHRAISLLVIALILVHAVATAFDAMGDNLVSVLVPGQEPWKEAVFAYNLGILALYMALLIGPTYYLRRFIGPGRWRLLHRFALLVYVLSMGWSVSQGRQRPASSRWW